MTVTDERLQRMRPFTGEAAPKVDRRLLPPGPRWPALLQSVALVRFRHQFVPYLHRKYGDVFTVRTVYVIGPDKKVKAMITYPASTGRNFDEILRVVDSIQLTAKYSVATPVNWKQGEDCIIVPALSDDAAKEKFPGGWKTLKPYLRIVPQPGK